MSPSSCSACAHRKGYGRWCVYISMCLYLYVCLYIYIYTCVCAVVRDGQPCELRAYRHGRKRNRNANRVNRITHDADVMKEDDDARVRGEV